MDKLKSNNKSSDKKKFKPCKIPRYLPGSVDLSHLYKDLETYNCHRYNCFIAETKIDTKPPPFHTLKYLKLSNIIKGAQRSRDIDVQNKDMLKKINMINRNKGMVDTFNPLTFVSLSRWRVKELQLKKIDKENHIIYDRLINIKSMYPREEHDMFYKKMVKKMEYSQRYPHYKINTRDDELKAQPSISYGLDIVQSIKRPRCFLEFQIPECQISLGKVIIELYINVVPKTVENFLTICKEKDNLTFKNCPVHKIFKDKYMVTGDITEGNGKGGACIYGDSFDEEDFSLKHSKAGVLSMVSLKGKNSSQFCITFNAMPSFDEKQVVFGKVIKGAENLFKVNDFGRKFGKPIMKVIISKCGVKKSKD